MAGARSPLSAAETPRLFSNKLKTRGHAISIRLQRQLKLERIHRERLIVVSPDFHLCYFAI
jgi:hypothetical protein